MASHDRRGRSGHRDRFARLGQPVPAGAAGSARTARHRSHGHHGSERAHRRDRRGLSGPTGTTGPEIEPVEEETDPPSEGADFSACEGLTGLDNAICRHEALLVVQPDNQGLQNSLAHLQENKAKHEAKSGDDDGGDVPPSEDGSSSSSNHGHGQSGESHGNAGGNGASNAGGNGKDH